MKVRSLMGAVENAPRPFPPGVSCMSMESICAERWAQHSLERFGRSCCDGEWRVVDADVDVDVDVFLAALLLFLASRTKGGAFIWSR